MRCRSSRFWSPRQYAAELRVSLKAGMNLVVGMCGPRHRSPHTFSPVRGSRLS
ncbi:Uncharacterised protein [Mycobacteroides abscessus subsp. abscessus]|nr:Uncharacterised protein [Mycobacteroides abscessus subsp. abscessus]